MPTEDFQNITFEEYQGLQPHWIQSAMGLWTLNNAQRRAAHKRQSRENQYGPIYSQGMTRLDSHQHEIALVNQVMFTEYISSWDTLKPGKGLDIQSSQLPILMTGQHAYEKLVSLEKALGLDGREDTMLHLERRNKNGSSFMFFSAEANHYMTDKEPNMHVVISYQIIKNR
jgi:hypothetical protein